MMMTSDQLGLSVVAQVRTDTGGRQCTCLDHQQLLLLLMVVLLVEVVLLVMVVRWWVALLLLYNHSCRRNA